jgi:hypothetical protein
MCCRRVETLRLRLTAYAADSPPPETAGSPERLYGSFRSSITRFRHLPHTLRAAIAERRRNTGFRVAANLSRVGVLTHRVSSACFIFPVAWLDSPRTASWRDVSVSVFRRRGRDRAAGLPERAQPIIILIFIFIIIPPPPRPPANHGEAASRCGMKLMIKMMMKGNGGSHRRRVGGRVGRCGCAGGDACATGRGVKPLATGLRAQSLSCRHGYWRVTHCPFDLSA